MSPLKSSSGITVRALPSTVDVALPSTKDENVNVSLSISEPIKPIVKEPSSSITWLSIKFKTGASLTGNTVSVKDCSEIYSPSKADITISPLPDQFGVDAIVNVLFEKIAVKFSSVVAVKKIISLSTLYTSNS